MTVTVTAVEEGKVYTAQVNGPKDALTLLERTFLPDGRVSKEQMFYKLAQDDPTRHARTYSMRSKSFHNFKGVTAEISRRGAIVILTGPIESGIEINVQVDLDDDDLQPMDLEAVVEWCTQRDLKSWIASLDFKPLTSEKDQVMQDFLEELKYRVPGSRPSTET